MDVLMEEGVHFILYLQKSWGRWEKEMLLLSKVGDPRNSFLIYFPVVYHLNHNLGVSVLWTAVISEWLNLVLKWILRGERPYWWVHESTKWQNVTLQQYELTCETGPGSPSGHAMVTSAVSCLLVFWMMNLLKETVLHQAHFWKRFFITVTVWSVLFTILVLVSVSRVFIATHFPHQVFLGTVIGIVVASAVKSYNSVLVKVSRSAIYCAICSLVLIGMTLLAYLTLSLLVYDPSTSVSKAQKWCVKASYIHLDTTPFYALVRDAGVTIGIGISVSMVVSSVKGRMNWRGLTPSRMSLLSQSVKIILSILLLQVLEVISLPKSNPLLFYIAGYIRCSLIPIIVIFLVPNIVM